MVHQAPMPALRRRAGGGRRPLERAGALPGPEATVTTQCMIINVRQHGTANSSNVIDNPI